MLVLGLYEHDRLHARLQGVAPGMPALTEMPAPTMHTILRARPERMYSATPARSKLLSSCSCTCICSQQAQAWLPFAMPYWLTQRKAVVAVDANGSRPNALSS